MENDAVRLDMKSDIVGQIDGVNRDRLNGWVLQNSSPQRRLEVELITPTGLRLVALADRYRADVHRAGFGDGHHGFSIPMRRLAGQASARVATVQPRIVLGNVDLFPPVAATDSSAAFQCTSYSLKIDRPMTGSFLTGWAFSHSDGCRRHVLSLRIGENIVERRRATIYRPEIISRECDGYHGFAFPLPTYVAQSIALEDVDTGLVFLVTP